MTAARAVPPHSSRRRGRWIVAALLIVVVAAVAVLLATRATPPSYRLALASRATVDQTLASSGTVSPVDHADLDFAVAGTVATVSATVGQHVTAGQQLAGLDTGTLDATVAQAQAQAAAAEAHHLDAAAQQLQAEAHLVASSAPAAGLPAQQPQAIQARSLCGRLPAGPRARPARRQAGAMYFAVLGVSRRSLRSLQLVPAQCGRARRAL